MTEIRFNINNYIKAKLTKRGHEIHRANYARLFAGYLVEKYPYAPPAEDADGWSKWQAWDFMSTFGPHMGCGSDVPASTEIIILVEPSA